MFPCHNAVCFLQRRCLFCACVFKAKMLLQHDVLSFVLSFCGLRRSRLNTLLWPFFNSTHELWILTCDLLIRPSSCSPAPEGPLRATSDLTKSAVPHLPVVQHYHRMYIRYSHRDPDHWLQTGDCWRWASFLLPFIFLSFTPPPSFSPSVMFSAVPCRQSSLTECLLCYGFIGLVCGRNLWIKVISHCSTFSQAVKLPFTFVPLGERDRERHM